MREFVILGSSIVTPPGPSSPSQHRHNNYIKHYKPSKLSLIRTPPPSSSPSSVLSTLPWNISNSHKIHIKHYADIASKLAEDGKLQDFSTVVESVITSGVDATQFFSAMNVELVRKGILVGLREGKVWTVVGVLKKVQKLGFSSPTLFDGSAMELLGRECRPLVKSGKVQEAVDLMEILAGFQLSIRHLVKPSDVIKHCVHNRNPNLAVRYASLLPEADILFSTIIHEFGRRRDLVSALKAYEASKKNLNGPNMYVYRTIIDACGLCGDYVQSRYIYEDLLNQKITPNIYVVNSLMNVNAHDLSYILNVYKNMQMLGVRADMASYNILLKACCLAGKVDLAQNIYKEVKDLESAGVLKLDVFTYSTIVKVFADAKLSQMALKIKQDMLSAGVSPNTIAWSSLINACANAGQVEQAILLFDEMLLAGCKPNTQCFNIILHACVEACQYDRAFRLFQSWTGSKHWDSFDGDHISSTYSNLGDGNGNRIPTVPNGKSNAHISNFAERFPFMPTTATYNILIKACGTDYYHAKALIEEMKIVGLSPNHISWSILIDIYGASGNVEGALEILRTMRDSGIKPDVIAYTTAIKVCVESKNLKQAFSLYEEMKAYEIHPNLVTYNTLLRARNRYGSLHEVQQCLAIYQDMRKAGYKPNDYYLHELIEEWCEGVIQNSNQNQEEFISCNKSELGRPHSLLLEKVAVHLQKNADSLAIDLQGLTKVEARIVVLAVLRMTKENYALGHSVKDDMLIIIGASKADANPLRHMSGVKDAITKLLQDEIGLQVIAARTRFPLNDTKGLKSPIDSDPNFEAIMGRNELPMMMGRHTRRPVVLQRLKVTKKSLHYWLQRKERANRILLGNMTV